METVIRAQGIKKSFKNLEVLKGIDVQVNKGEVLAIIGPSGSGKSTLLRCLVRLEKIDAGSIEIDGKAMATMGDKGVEYAPESELRVMRRSMGMVFQNFNLFPHLSVLENLIEAPLRVLKEPRAQAEENAMRLLDKVGLTAKRDNYPFELSGGQRQRVAIARAMAMNPCILCFDEPTSALDPELTGEVLKVIQDLAQENMTMIVVTHEMGFASKVADRVIFMDEGTIVAQGKPDEVLLNSGNERIQAFLSKVLHA